MTEIKKLKNEFSKFNKKSDYLILDNGQGKKTYTIYSGELKQSLRKIVHAKASEEWQIKHVLGENFIEYGIEQNGEFGLYRKNLVVNSPDEFLIVLEGKSSLEREEFTSAAQDCEKSRQKIEIERKQIEMIRQKNDQENKGLESNVLGENCISITFQKGKNGERLMTKKEHYNDTSKVQEIREGWAYNFTKQMLSEWAQKQKDKGFKKVIENVVDDKKNERKKADKTFHSSKEDQEKLVSCASSQSKNSSSDSNFPVTWIIGGGIIAVIGLTTLIIVKSNKKKKRL